MRALAAAVAWLLLLGGCATAHEITFSHMDLRLDHRETLLSVKLPIKGLLQQEPPVLPAGTTDAALRADPLSPVLGAALSELLASRLKLAADGAPLALSVGSIRPAGDDIALSATAPAIAGTLDVTANLLPDDPAHKLFLSIYRGEVLAGQYALDRDNATLTLAASDRPLTEVIATFVREGIHHIFIGQDHILFVLALILLGGTLWSQFKIVTAFTVAHSITLTLAALGLVQLPSRLVESVIALSIVVVGAHDVWQLQRGGTPLTARDPRALFAFFFGLVHGFGFASVLAELDLPREALVWSLAAFNVGVEIGQLTIVLVAAPFLAALRRYVPPRVAYFPLTAAACLVVLMGTIWLWDRALGT